MLRKLIHNRIVRRVASMIGTLLGVAVFVFIMLRAIPGDQITAGLGTEAAALSPAQQEALQRYYGLDQPLFTQFFSWLGNLFTGNLGYSARAQQSVLDLTLRSLPVTFELAVLSIILALLIGIPLGMLAASKPDSGRDAFGQFVSLAGLSVPAFLLATTLLSVFASSFGFNPNGQGYATLAGDPLLNLRQMLMPAIVLGFGIAAPILRTTRTAVLEIRSDDFVRTARAKGVPARRLQTKHVLGNALVPIVTMTGLQFGYLLGGAVVVEQIFSVPGIGRQVLLGIQQKEYAVVQSTVLVIALTFVIVNLLTDLLYRVIDPRVRAS
ncbi:ABC transporter permease [Sphaerisporangium perillae]|uniref:ABC transporter permease n=1 Tax=Sphaerisporangium perillae TaxID=2935860 RepID=UPI0020102C60|nr:ABC transporter permease [Sphaerisporangium perillae]